MSTSFRLILPRAIHAAMLSHAAVELPNECCGLLAGRLIETPDGHLGQVAHCLPLINAAASPREFLSTGESMFAAIREIRRHNAEELAIYHSHPTSDPIPSRTDLERNYSPRVVNLIISLKTGVPSIRCWWLGETDYREAEWECRD
jgi:proteasome lid subunit RPN8/RPN11